MEEQRARQEDESRKATAASTEGISVDKPMEGKSEWALTGSVIV